MRSLSVERGGWFGLLAAWVLLAVSFALSAQAADAKLGTGHGGLPADAPTVRVWRGPAAATAAQALAELERTAPIAALTALPAPSLFGEDSHAIAWEASGVPEQSVWLVWTLPAHAQAWALHAEHPYLTRAQVWLGAVNLELAQQTGNWNAKKRFVLPASAEPQQALMQLASPLHWRSTVRLEPLDMPHAHARLSDFASFVLGLYALSALYAFCVVWKYKDRLHALYGVFSVIMIANSVLSQGSFGTLGIGGQEFVKAHLLVHLCIALVALALAVEAFSIRQRQPLLAHWLNLGAVFLATVALAMAILPSHTLMLVVRAFSTIASVVAFGLLARELVNKQWRGLALVWTCGFLPLGLLSAVYGGVHTGALHAEGWVIELVSIAGVLDVAFNSVGLVFYLRALRLRSSQRDIAMAEVEQANAVQIEVLRAKIALTLRAGGLTRAGCAVLVIRPVTALPKSIRKPLGNGRNSRIVMDAATAAARWGDSITRIDTQDFAMLLGGTNDESQTRVVAQQVIANVRQAVQNEAGNELNGVRVAFALISHRSPKLDSEQWLARLGSLLDSANGMPPNAALLCLHNGLAFGEAGISLARTARDAVYS